MRFLSVALVALPLPIMAETFTTTSSPTAATVYSGFAMVTREVSVEVPAGAHQIILPDLPQWVDAGSLRASISGADITSTRLRTAALPPQPDSDSQAVVAAKEQIKLAERALRDLDDAIQDAELAIQSAEARLAFLGNLSSSETLPSDPLALAELAAMIEAQTLTAKQTQLNAQREARQISEARPDLLRDLEDAKAALDALTPPAEPKALLALSVDAKEAGTIIATVSYPARASWQPTYDVALATGDDATMTLRRAALVHQNTGENWDNIALTLSTLTPSGQIVPSELYPPLLRFEDPQLRAKLQRSVSGLSAGMAEDVAEPAMMEAAPSPQPNFDGPGVRYTLPSPISIAQNAEGARVELDALEFGARVFARAVPASDQTAFLMAESENASKESLLAANSAQIFVDGTLVGQSYFSAVPAGGEIVQAFGPIEDLRLKRTVLDLSEGDRGLISRTNAQTQEIRMEIENLGAKAWDVELLEAIPYSEQDDLEIEWSAKPQPSITDVDNRRGLMQWNFSIGANDNKEITTEQFIRWPDGKVLR
ncbi:DUF4139 domain-containing protein [Sulfitobacter donghicola]|uniref:DUF4139 domain-containing protein n=1 Tax=Sulfitobacter donghicola DSW-25 = KCTC 12864 = JCM 14565 TaxID=1300350 RepID=A0A073IMW1_9RHOB|nr:DUF4139 domain-containing protein [Sulfitobacter donghicola]KEJ91044.1 hypothetical protein DSW25_00625 [Sulfitobacter donghicola DSW-25 = KCTC 12864 = JCM 14565]KIN67692.1 DUF4139 multi-domain protein [Sulfitobacter donghicola DSW-25 = KCTC 12864 = JCM 14565]